MKKKISVLLVLLMFCFALIGTSCSSGQKTEKAEEKTGKTGEKEQTSTP